jgi:hypothetical protein
MAAEAELVEVLLLIGERVRDNAQDLSHPI